MRTMLLTGFGPFGPYPTNPSWEAVRVLEGEVIGRTRIRTARLDVTYESAGAQLREALRDTRPDLVVSLGVAPGPAIRIETLARNRDDCPQPDNAGVVREDQPIRPDGCEFLPTRLPVKTILSALVQAGYEARTSEDAGGYLCNHVFYRLLDELGDDRPAGFVHVPAPESPWSTERLRAAVRLLAETL